jgi:hypothetical protein
MHIKVKGNWRQEITLLCLLYSESDGCHDNTQTYKYLPRQVSLMLLICSQDSV